MKKLALILLGLVFVLPFATPVLAANVYTSQQVATHTTASDCWTIVNNKIYNVSSFMTLHPGGQAAINSLCGINGSTLFNTQHGSSAAANAALINYYIGDLAVVINDTVAPSVPANLSASPVSPNRINLNWSASTDNVKVTGYKIFSGNSQIGTSTVTSFSSTNLATSTVYSFSVSAFDASGNTSASSSAVSATTTAAYVSALNTPIRLRASLKDHQKIKLSWDMPKNTRGIKGYKIMRDGIMIGSSKNRNFMDSSIVASTTYVYSVIAFDRSGNLSPTSNSVTITTRGKKVHNDEKNKLENKKEEREHGQSNDDKKFSQNAQKQNDNKKD